MFNDHVLLVEDNPDDEALTLRSLRKNNFPYPVSVVRDGQEALDYIHGKGEHAGRDLARTPVLILLDLNLPRIGGIDVLRHLRSDARLRHSVVVILTSSNEEHDMAECHNLGANLYIRKPVGTSESDAVVGKIQDLLKAFHGFQKA